MGHRNAVVSRHRNGRGNARHDLIGHSILVQQLQLFPAPSEQEGVAAFQPHHHPALQGLLQQNLIDLPLGTGMISCPFAHVDTLRFRGNQGKHRIPHQSVIDHHFRLGQQLSCPAGHQAHISRTCANQIYLSRHRAGSSSSTAAFS